MGLDFLVTYTEGIIITSIEQDLGEPKSVRIQSIGGYNNLGLKIKGTTYGFKDYTDLVFDFPLEESDWSNTSNPRFGPFIQLTETQL